MRSSGGGYFRSAKHCNGLSCNLLATAVWNGIRTAKLWVIGPMLLTADGDSTSHGGQHSDNPAVFGSNGLTLSFSHCSVVVATLVKVVMVLPCQVPDSGTHLCSFKPMELKHALQVKHMPKCFSELGPKVLFSAILYIHVLKITPTASMWSL